MSETFTISRSLKDRIDGWKFALFLGIGVPMAISMTILGFMANDPTTSLIYSLGGLGWCLFAMEYMYRHYVDFEVEE